MITRMITRMIIRMLGLPPGGGTPAPAARSLRIISHSKCIESYSRGRSNVSVKHRTSYVRKGNNKTENRRVCQVIKACKNRSNVQVVTLKALMRLQTDVKPERSGSTKIRMDLVASIVSHSAETLSIGRYHRAPDAPLHKSSQAQQIDRHG